MLNMWASVVQDPESGESGFSLTAIINWPLCWFIWWTRALGTCHVSFVKKAGGQFCGGSGVISTCSIIPDVSKHLLDYSLPDPSLSVYHSMSQYRQPPQPGVEVEPGSGPLHKKQKTLITFFLCLVPFSQPRPCVSQTVVSVAYICALWTNTIKWFIIWTPIYFWHKECIKGWIAMLQYYLESTPRKKPIPTPFFQLLVHLNVN